MAVVKANAYGHEQYLVAPTLFEEGCRSFAVTDAREGEELRAIIGEHDSCEISLLSGLFSQDDANCCVSHRLTPVITEAFQIELLKRAGYNDNIWLKFDSGMNRLGAADPAGLFSLANEAGLRIRGFMSHLACADEPDHPMNRMQVGRFATTCDLIDPHTPKSLLNSAGIVSMPEHAFDVVRPGIALYGAEPIPDQPIGLKPVMRLTGEVLQVRKVRAGETISYGATFTANNNMQIAVVGIGYADGIPRPLSNRGSVCIGEEKHAITGRVCMDYTMVNVTGSATKRGDLVEFWGEQILANNVAAEINTISYTLFTGVGERVRRVAV